MKGLVIKDLICMKKQLVIFSYTIITVFIVAVMFVISAKYGNIALGAKEMLKENPMTEMDLQSMMVWALMGMMLLPIAAVSDFSQLFRADFKAGFSVVSASLPLSIKKRLLAKYLTVFSLIGIGIVVDLVIAFVLSMITDLVSFAEFCGIIFSMASVLIMLGTVTIIFVFLLGKGKEDYATLLSLVSLVSLGVVLNYQKVKLIISDDAPDSMFSDFVNYLVDKSYVVVFSAVVITIVSYFVSLAIVNRKRGVI